MSAEAAPRAPWRSAVPADEPPMIGIADVLRAWDRLDAGGDDLRGVARLLGFDLPVAEPAPTPVDVGARPGVHRLPGRTGTPGPVRPEVTRGGTGGSVPRARPTAGGATRAATVTYSRHLRPARQELGLAERPPSDRPLPVQDRATRRAALPLIPLLAPRVTPAIVSALLATDAGDGPLDVTALTGLVARRRFDAPVPRTVRRSLFRGVQLLLDRGPGMAPFRRDVRGLAAAVEAVVGRDTEQVAFVGTVAHVLPYGTPPYRMPRPCTPVLAVSDLGIGTPLGERPDDLELAWLDLAARLRARGSSLVALVPYPPARWPVPLAEAIPIVQWDTGTTLADVARAVGRVLGGRRDRT